METPGVLLYIILVISPAFAKSEVSSDLMAPDGPVSAETVYSGVIDAGSTGTRLNIYGFVGGKIKHQGLFTNTPGLAGITDDKEIRTLAKELFTHAEPFYSNIKEIPIGFYGTAGFRTLDESRSTHILELVRDELKGYNLKETKVISGEEEGKLALMALILSSDEDKEPNNGPSNKSIGVIDMGGRSAQIATLTEDGQISSESMDLGIMTIDVGEELHECLIEKNEEQELCARHLMLKLGGLEKKPALNDIKNLYLLSYFHDEFRKTVRDEKTSMKEIKDKFYKQCNLLKTNGCRNMFYLISFIKRLGIRDDKSIHHIDTNNGINITWASGKGYELSRRYNR